MKNLAVQKHLKGGSFPTFIPLVKPKKPTILEEKKPINTETDLFRVMTAAMRVSR